MHDRELFEKTFSALHASPDTLTEVRKTMQNEKKTRRALGKGAVIAIAAALTLTVAVAGGIVTLIKADVSPADKVDDTTHHAFTDDIDSSSPDFVEDGKGGYVPVADMERIPGDVKTTERLVGKYLSKLNAELTVEGSTYKMGTFLVDEMGNGIMTFSVENPDGFKASDGLSYADTWLRDVRISLDYGRTAPGVDPQGYGYTFADDNLCVDENDSTETCLQVIDYFICGKGYEKGMNFYFSVTDSADQQRTIAIKPQSHLPVKTLTTENGQKTYISPVGMTMVDTLYGTEEISDDELYIHYQDGTDYAVRSRSNNLLNWMVGYVTGGYDDPEFDYYGTVLGITDPPAGTYYSYLFNRLVDVDTVSSITLEGRVYNPVTDRGEPMQQTYLP